MENINDVLFSKPDQNYEVDEKIFFKTVHPTTFIHTNKVISNQEEMLFCYQNCSDLL